MLAFSTYWPSRVLVTTLSRFWLSPVRLGGYLAGYAKGQGSRWAVTRERLDVATARANALPAAGHTAEGGTQPYTNMHELVHRLLHLKEQAA